MGVGEAIHLDRDGHVLLSVHVQPSARRDQIVGQHGTALKLRVTAPPEGGRANRAVAELLAKTLAIPKTAVELASGGSNRHKRYRITGVTADEVADRLSSP